MSFPKVYVIAEIGINHNGDFLIAKELIDIAADAGANAVKFQKRTINKVYSEEFLDSYRDSPWGNTQRDQKMGLEFNLTQYRELKEYCNFKKIDSFASCWDINSQHEMNFFNDKYNKIASAMTTYKEFLEVVAKQKKYTFISTGMTNKSQISEVIEIFNREKCPFELMHCVSTYPMIDEDANLSRITTLRKEFDCNVGYSGHETGIIPSIGAVCLGATSLERHITLDRSMYGSDQSASIEPDSYKHLVSSIRKLSLCMGNGELEPNKKELTLSKKLRGHFLEG